MIDKYGAELSYNFRSLIFKNLDIFVININERDSIDKEREKKIKDKIMQLDNYEDEDVQKKLDKYRHYITEIRGLNKLINLEELDLTGNEISEIKGLENLRNLRKLYLDDNQIFEIKGLSNLKNLEFLGLSNNKLKPIPELVYISYPY